MRLTVLGSSPACPNPGNACAGYLLELPGARIVIDCGHGAIGFLETMIPLSDVSAIIISHMHPDHFFDLVPLKYGLQFSGVSKKPLHLPPHGRETLHRLEDALQLGPCFWSDAYEIEEYDPRSGLELHGTSVSFAATQHFIPAYAMAFEAAGSHGRIAYSSDTGWSDSVAKLLDRADLAVVEATLPVSAEGTVREGHMTARQAGEMARLAGVQRLVLTHYWHANSAEAQLEATYAFGRPVDMARQGSTYEV